MSAAPPVGLVTIVHDPAGRLHPQAQEHLAELRSLCPGLIVCPSQPTAPRLVEACREVGALISPAGEATGPAGIGRVRLSALRAGLAQGYPWLHLCDFDSALHWIAAYPDELEGVIQRIPRFDLLILGRTDRAQATLPRSQGQTERWINHVFDLTYGERLERVPAGDAVDENPPDICAGAWGLSQVAAQLLVGLAQEDGVGMHAEWPMLLGRVEEMRLGYLPTEGMEFETADRYPEEVEAAGGVEAWKAQRDASPDQWLYRLEIAHDIVATAVRLSEESAG